MWAVVIYNDKHKHIEKFHSMKGYYGAGRYFLRMKRRFGKFPSIKIEIISCLKAYPPSGKGKKGEWWCPYCRRWRKFKSNGYLGVKQCKVCGVSDREWYVKKYNGLLEKPKKK